MIEFSINLPHIKQSCKREKPSIGGYKYGSKNCS
nr:MAG TPA: hypothetical protein [Caudoviricetes sp.]